MILCIYVCECLNKWTYKMKIYSILLGTSLILTMTTAGRELEVSTECMEDCKVICIKLEGADALVCDNACSLGCKQLLGKGRPTGNAS